uniref:C3H1-type domain-containing protein n=1 Tax=Panagrolaimus superbus TaxID=310955 RepID=A0A914XXC8_9BILA
MAEENGTAGLEQDIKNDLNQKQSANGNASGGGGGGKKRGKDDVCRDFLNGICNRGNRCRFRHPETEDHSAPNHSSITPYTFCIDFQNKGCFRESCRFIHASGQDAEHYQQKGIVSLPLARAIAATLTINDSINGIPICKEFQTGACSRGGNRCRYWHVNVDEERAARTNMLRMGGNAPGVPMGMPSYTPGMRRGAPMPLDYEYDHIPVKRAFPGRMPLPHPPSSYGMEPPSAYVTSLERRNAELEKENEALRREVDREKSRYEDLMAVFKGQQQQHAAPAPVPPPMQHPQYPGWGHHESHHPSWS